MELTLGGPLFKRLQWLEQIAPGFAVNGAVLEVVKTATENTEARKQDPKCRVKAVTTPIADFKKLQSIIATDCKDEWTEFISTFKGVRFTFCPVWGVDGLFIAVPLADNVLR